VSLYNGGKRTVWTNLDASDLKKKLSDVQNRFRHRFCHQRQVYNQLFVAKLWSLAMVLGLNYKRENDYLDFCIGQWQISSHYA